MKNVVCPRVVIAAPASGSGKSVIASGLMAFFSKRMKVQGFKVGPDYIDPMYHYQATGIAGRNLDTWMLAPNQVKKIFIRAAQKVDISVIEGVMGLFDGSTEFSSIAHGLSAGSTAEVALLLDTPIILVVDAQKMAHSAAAIVHGFNTLHENVKIHGVIFNRVGSARHENLLKQATQQIGITMLGCIPKSKELHIPERHLGLFTVVERYEEAKAFLENAASVISNYVDTEALLHIAKQTSPLYCESVEERDSKDFMVNIAYARDEAFCFYYEDNLEELKKEGARVIPFSPIFDEKLPQDTHGIYFGGGYPELYAEMISQNKTLLEEISHLANNGLPIYAECGGLMVLTQGMMNDDGKIIPFIGILPGYTRLSSKLSMGYRKVTAYQDGLFIRRGDNFRGHEFHYSVWDGFLENKAAYCIQANEKTPLPILEGYTDKNILASYIHLHFMQSEEIGRRFVKTCMKYKG